MREAFAAFVGIVGVVGRASVVFLFRDDGARRLEAGVIGSTPVVDLASARLESRIAENTVKLERLTRLVDESIDDRFGLYRPKDPEARKRYDDLDKSDADSLAALADWVAGRGLADDAKRISRRALLTDPENPAAHQRLGDVMKDGKWTSPVNLELEAARIKQARVEEQVAELTMRIDLMSSQLQNLVESQLGML